MALSTVTRAQLRGDLRLRLNEITEEKFVDEELNRWLNLGQYQAAIELNGISSIWYGTEQALTSTATGANGLPYVDISSYLVLKLDSVVYYPSGGTPEMIPIKEFKELLPYAANSYYSTSKAVAALWAQRIYLSTSLTVGLGNTIIVNYYKRPTEMATDATAMDVPQEFQELVIMYALKIAYDKLKLIDAKNTLDINIAEKLNTIKQSFAEGNQLDITPIKKSK